MTWYQYRGTHVEIGKDMHEKSGYRFIGEHCEPKVWIELALFDKMFPYLDEAQTEINCLHILLKFWQQEDWMEDVKKPSPEGEGREVPLSIQQRRLI